MNNKKIGNAGGRGNAGAGAARKGKGQEEKRRETGCLDTQAGW